MYCVVCVREWWSGRGRIVPSGVEVVEHIVKEGVVVKYT